MIIEESDVMGENAELELVDDLFWAVAIGEAAARITAAKTAERTEINFLRSVRCYKFD